MIGFTRPPCDAGVIHGRPLLPRRCHQAQAPALAATILGSSMAFIDGSVVNIALPRSSRRWHADAASTQWIVNAYLLLLGALVLVGGSLPIFTDAGGSFLPALRYLPRPRLPAACRQT